MSEKTNLLMLVLILSLSLTSSAFSSPLYKINSVTFNPTSTASVIKEGMINSVSGIVPGHSYDKEQIEAMLKRAESRLGVKIVKWDLSTTGSLTVDFTKKRHIRSLSFEGNSYFSDSDIKEEVGFRAEGAYCEDVCLPIKQKTEKFYNDSGYFEAKVEVKEQAYDKGVDVTVSVQEGAPCIIDSVNIESDGPISKRILARVLSIKKGAPACSTCVQESIKSLRSYLYNRGYYSSSVYRDSVRFSADMKTASINVGVKTGPKYHIIFRGNSFFKSSGVLRDSLDISDTVVITKDYYSILAKKLEDFYKSFGFADVKVDFAEELGTSPGEIFLVFKIIEGKQKFIGRVNYDFRRKTEEIKGIDSYLRNSKIDFFDKGFFVRKEFEDSKELIEKYLNSIGYLRAKVLSLTFSQGKRDYENVNYQIDLGQPTLVREIVVKGNTYIKTDKLIEKIGVAKGSPVEIEKLRQGLKWIVEQYRENGFVDFYLDKEKLFSYNNDYRFVDVYLLISEGERVKVGEIYINGISRTKERVITREILFLKDETIKDKDIQGTENALAGLGFLGSASVNVLPTSVKGNGYRDVLISIEEKKANSYEIGIGYRTDEGIKVSSGISYGNLGGWGRRIYANGAVSRKIGGNFRFAEYDVLTGYYEPYFLNIPLDFRVVVEARKDDYPDYAQKTLDTAFYFEKRLGSHSLILRNAFERINIFEAVNPLDNASYWKYSIRPTYRFDTRDSIFSPTKGFSFSIYGEWGKSLNTSIITNYAKVVERMRFYLPLFSKFTLMSSVDAGYVKGLGGDPVLLEDRFTLGGFDSIRGYREGIIADLTPNISDQKFYTFSLELRRELFWNFVASVFHDMGGVSSEDSQVHGTYSSVGGGIGIKFPVGSLSLQYGYVYRKDKRIPADKSGRIHFAIGTF